ncbi:MAG: hypothetical protein US49_C0002G0121 [candidate division TM6 bacterium GW2011_GWF2_37_49]|nr:MAG: hypothetical protein US49_C0002G0121 [candidate division TM6 bacterium GW2011_GWF2_37_49]
MFTKIARYSRRIIELGCKNLFLTLKYRLRKKLFRLRFYKKALRSEANHTNANQIEWQKDFKVEQLKNTNKILESAWQQQKNIFYQDIKISCPKIMQADEYNPDVKVPWEMSRFQHIFELSAAYKQTGDKKYAESFKYQVEDWINQNPYLLGVNWLCPMEVGIRAINWIHGFNCFKDDKIIPNEFWQKFTRSLYDHMHFLENNWEWSDRPNNHYLADLLGYFYLCEFLGDTRTKKNWVVKTMIEQFFQQIQPDGTSYEGSTNYHKLDTEIFLHFKQLCDATKTALPQEFCYRLTKMEQFLQDCSDEAGNLAQIGDNDSGKITTGVAPFVPVRLRYATLRANGGGKSVRGDTSIQFFGRSSRVFCKAKCIEGCGLQNHSVRAIYFSRRNRSHTNDIKTYPNFGLTIIKNNGLHITFRHATFNKRQPTGHFHQDQLAITLSLKGIPILIDPGTGAYTANSGLRNQLRSFESHNTFYPVQEHCFDELFQLEREGHCEDKTSLQGACKHKNQTAHRKLELIKQNNELKIEDWIENSDSGAWKWNLIFAPEIYLEKIDANSWKIKRKNNPLMLIQSTLDFEEQSWIYSIEYGKIQACKKLVAQKSSTASQNCTQTLLKFY